MKDNKSGRLISSGIENVSQSFYDSFVQENAEMRASAGMKTTITREQLGNCCEWCAEISGTYDIDKAPEDIYRRHQFCRCLVTVHNEKGYTDVWSKITYKSREKAIDERTEEIRREKELEKDMRKRLIVGMDNPNNKGIIASKILTGKYPLEYRKEKYLQHVKGTKQYELTTKQRGRKQSYLIISEQQAQQIIYDYAGTGIIDDFNNPTKEYLDVKENIGYYYEKDEWVATNRIMILYSKEGTHIVPVRKI